MYATYNGGKSVVAERIIRTLLDPKLKIGDHATISKYKNIFAKGYTPN